MGKTISKIRTLQNFDEFEDEKFKLLIQIESNQYRYCMVCKDLNDENREELAI